MSEIIMPELKNDPALKKYTLSDLPLLKELKDDYMSSKTAVCIERAKYVTEYMKESENKGEPMILRRAKALNRYFTEREPLFLDNNMLAGASTSKKIGAPVYPEFVSCIGIWPELETITNRKANPQTLSKEDAEELNFHIFPYWMDRTVLETVRREQKELEKTIGLSEKLVFFLPGKAGTLSHTTPRYEDVLKKGLLAMIEEARAAELQVKNTSRNGESADQIALLEAMQISMQGLLNYTTRLASKAEGLAAKETDPVKKASYQKMADVCRKVPAHPAESYREAVNALWICHVGVLAENINMALNPGRIDQVLYPYYKSDVEKGRLTVIEALNITGCLWFKLGDNTNLVPETAEKLFGGAGSVPAVTLGGIDAKGNNAVNDLTYIMLKVTELLSLKDPNVNARFNRDKNPQSYINRVADVIINTRAIPAVYNDLANIETLINQGVKPEHANDYAVIGCVELASAGREYSSSSSILMNLSAPFYLTLFNGKRPAIMGDTQISPPSGDITQFNSYEQFWQAFATQFKWLAGEAIKLNEALGLAHQRLLPTPLLSSFFEGPLEKKKDLIFGGALYNSSGVTHVAFADICDSLNAIEYAVFDQKITTMKDILEAIRTNFAAPYERLRDYLRYQCPKYGTDHPIAMKNSKNLIKLIYDFYQAHTNYRGGKYRPAFWTMTNHAGLGTRAEALPSGRKAGELFSSGITPSSQCTPDVTGAFEAVAALDNKNIPGGVALNIKYTPPAVNTSAEDYRKDFVGLIDGYFQASGMQVQFNVQTYETLKDAKANPSKYPGLIVRVSGYSAFFKDLNTAMQDELITRSEYNLKSGQAVPLVKF